jgi:ABC-2 type transport system permease protein
MSRNSFLAYAQAKLAFAIFLFGKIFRFVFFLLFLQFVVLGTKGLAGYSVDQVVFFFVTFTLIDTVTQFLFREVYRFRPQIISGSFDLTLSKPFSPLFKSLAGGADLIDLVVIPPLLYIVIQSGMKLSPSPQQVLVYVLLVASGLAIATAFHIAVLSLAIITLEVDHTVMIYRDLMSMGRFPIDIYRQPLRGFLTYLLPVGVMVTLPGRYLMGLTSISGLALSLSLAFIFIFLSLQLWRFALRFYTSASS